MRDGLLARVITRDNLEWRGLVRIGFHGLNNPSHITLVISVSKISAVFQFQITNKRIQGGRRDII